MDQDSVDQYAQFLLQSRVNSRLVEFRQPVPSDGSSGLLKHGVHRRCAERRHLGRLHLLRARRAHRAAYGTYSVLWQIEQTRQLRLPHLYLGYWIEQSDKMGYKAGFRPHQVLVDGHWRDAEA